MFRCWDTIEKKFTDTDFNLMGETIIFGHAPFQTCSIEHLNNLEIQQWTGLKDKNGKYIYEGDIILSYESSFSFKETGLDNSTILVEVNQKPFLDVVCMHGHIVYNCASFCLQNKEDGQLHMISDLLYQYEVIGNIYENPELH